MIERFLKWIGYEEAWKGEPQPELQPEPQQRRRYQIPQGLCPKVAFLMDKLEGPDHYVAKLALWSLIKDRCPETRQGRWEISHEGHVMFVQERR